jgi:hypothetical protein
MRSSRRRLVLALFALAAGAALGAACDDDPGKDCCTPPPYTSTPFTPGPTVAGGELFGDMEEALQALVAGDGDRLERLLTLVQAPCEENPDAEGFPPPVCPEGERPGTLVASLITGGCPDDAYFVDASGSDVVHVRPLAPGLDHQVGVLEVGRPPLAYALLVGAEKILWLGFDGAGRFIGLGGGGSCPTADLRARLEDAAWLTGPDWSE